MRYTTNYTPNEYYGAEPSKVDLRDYKIVAGAINVKSFELPNLPPVKHQGTVSSCVAHTSSSIVEWFNFKELNVHREMSVGFIYGMQGIECDRLEGGMYLRDACKILQKYGDCLATTVPYNIEMPECYEKLAEEITNEVYHEAAIAKVKTYARCTTDEAIKHALMNYGPVLGRVIWYDRYTFDGDILLFNTKLGRSSSHAVMVYGFNEKGWLCQNSWGTEWGNKGRFVLPYEHGIAEAWSFVDAKNADVYKPKSSTCAALDKLYKQTSNLINLFKKSK